MKSCATTATTDVIYIKDDWRNGDDDVEDEWADHYSNMLNWYIGEHDRDR